MDEYIKQKTQGGEKSICDSCTHRYVCTAINNQPCIECNHYQCTADVEPVVRCRECKYHNKPPCPMRLSFNWTEDNDFCSYGERKDGDK